MHPRPSAPQPPPSHLPRWLPAGVVLAWAVATAVAFWWFEGRDRHPLDPAEVLAYFDRAPVAARAEAWLRATHPAGARATVVHVAAGECSCSRNAERHLAEIAARYRPRRVAFLRARPDWVAATPAALVFDANGHLVYFGPYSDEADCGTSGGFVERTLDALLDRTARAPVRPLGIGCFCLTTRA